MIHAPHIESTPAFRPSVDRVKFEILKHRIWQINDEQGTTLKRVSGSPVATEVQDFNVGIATAEGQLVATGMYLLAHVTGLSQVIQNCMKIVGPERIRAGDMFVTNDPWMGAVHQNDVAIVAPLHHDGRLVGWTGSVIHQSDVGGPVPGSWNLDAYDTFQEAPRYRFLKIVDGGSVSDEVMATLMTNSRFPQLVELDLRAQIAAATVARGRMAELFARYGVEDVTAVMTDCLSNTEVMLRRRLLEIPDGVFTAESHVDHDGHEDSITTIRLTLEKAGDRLVFDFTQSDPQAQGLINCTRSTLISAPFSVVLTYLCAGIPWNEGVMRCVEVRSTPGSVVDCEFPAPVASGIVNAGWAALNACGRTVAGMLLASDEHRDKLMAVWAGAPFGVNVFGRTVAGESFGTLLGLSSLQGAGARSFADGYDVAGYLHSPRCGAMNVETAEANYPLLHLCREVGRDSGGPGKYRGGAGVRMAIIAYGAASFEVVTTAFGSDQSGSDGVAGGYPGGGANSVLITGGEPLRALHNGSTEALLSAGGERRPMPAKARFKLENGDVLLLLTHGGGGFGDPLLRDAEAVAADVRNTIVSHEWAERAYGVVVTPEGNVAPEPTMQRRAVIRRDRLAQSSGVRSIAESSASVDLPLVTAGPNLAVRWGGYSLRFRLRLEICAETGAVLDTTQYRLHEEDAR